MNRTVEPTTLELVEIAGFADHAVATTALHGEVDGFTAPGLHAELVGILDRPAVRLLVLDLDRVSFLSSGGIALLVELVGDARHRGVDLRLVADPAGQVYRTLRMTGMAGHLPLHRSRGDALPVR